MGWPLLPSISADPLHSAQVNHRWVGPSCGCHRGSVFQGWPVFRPCCSILQSLLCSWWSTQEALVLLVASFESSRGLGVGVSLTLSSVIAQIASSARLATPSISDPATVRRISCNGDVMSKHRRIVRFIARRDVNCLLRVHMQLSCLRVLSKYWMLLLYRTHARSLPTQLLVFCASGPLEAALRTRFLRTAPKKYAFLTSIMSVA